jgi:hypothetical protein
VALAAAIAVFFAHALALAVAITFALVMVLWPIAAIHMLQFVTGQVTHDVSPWMYRTNIVQQGPADIVTMTISR